MNKDINTKEGRASFNHYLANFILNDLRYYVNRKLFNFKNPIISPLEFHCLVRAMWDGTISRYQGKKDLKWLIEDRNKKTEEEILDLKSKARRMYEKIDR